MTARSIILLIFCIILVIFFFIFITPGYEGIKHLIELGPVTGQLQVAGEAPQVILVYLEDGYCDEPGGIYKPEINPNLDSNKAILFNATVYDINGDCNGNATFYICSNESAIPPIYCDKNHYVSSILATLDAQYGGSKNNLYCNYSATYSLPYYMKCGNWYINVTAFDTTEKSNSTVRWWKDNLLAGVYYPYSNEIRKIGGLVYMETVNLNQWNENKGRNMTKNVGNVNISSLTWNATDFNRTESPYDIIPIEPKDGFTTFAIDNDQNRANGAGYINDDPLVPITFPSLYGLNRCEDFDCNTDRAKYDLWWHIFVPPAISSGIYENKIEYSYTPMEGICD